MEDITPDETFPMLRGYVENAASHLEFDELKDEGGEHDADTNELLESLRQSGVELLNILESDLDISEQIKCCKKIMDDIIKAKIELDLENPAGDKNHEISTGIDNACAYLCRITRVIIAH